MVEKRKLHIELLDPRVVEVLRKMTPEQRLKRAFECTSFVLNVVRRAIQTQHPDWDKKQVTEELIRRLHFVGIGEIDWRDCCRV